MCVLFSVGGLVFDDRLSSVVLSLVCSSFRGSLSPALRNETGIDLSFVSLFHIEWSCWLVCLASSASVNVPIFAPLVTMPRAIPRLASFARVFTLRLLPRVFGSDLVVFVCPALSFAFWFAFFRHVIVIVFNASTGLLKAVMAW